VSSEIGSRANALAVGRLACLPVLEVAVDAGIFDVLVAADGDAGTKVLASGHAATHGADDAKALVDLSERSVVLSRRATGQSEQDSKHGEQQAAGDLTDTPLTAAFLCHPLITPQK
jgi:hypothetical protein